MRKSCLEVPCSRYLLPNHPFGNVTEVVSILSKFFPCLNNFNESRWVKSVNFSYLESLKNVVKDNSGGYLCHVLITKHDKGRIVSLKWFIFRELVHRSQKSEKSMFNGCLPHFVYEYEETK